MKAKNLILVQVVLLVLAAFMGIVLSSNPSSELRLFHRIDGMLAGLIGLVGAVLLYRDTSVSGQLKGLSVLSVVAAFVAGYAGNMIIVGDYSQMMILMRVGGFVSLLSSGYVLAKLWKK
jgi:hypothetical protein